MLYTPHPKKPQGSLPQRKNKGYQTQLVSGATLPKKCTKCKELGSNFRTRKNKYGTYYYFSWCNQCQNKSGKAYLRKLRETDPAKYYRVRRHDQLKSKFGISLVEYEERLAQQGSVCAICGASGSRSMPVDHNHKTGKIRGILCHWCNKGLGQFFDDPKKLRKAIKYLENDGVI